MGKTAEIPVPVYSSEPALLLPPDIAAPLSRSWSEAEAFAYCSKFTHGHYENFPVGSVFIPRRLQPAIHSLYAFMRTADDFSDENRVPGDETERMAYLNTWETLLSECEEGSARHPVFVALRATLKQHPLPIQCLRDLLIAFKMDVNVRRYAHYNDVLAYCRYSANPVGRLILTLFGYQDEALYQLSDSICTALQLANHWQDVAIDLEKDRIYLPQEDIAKFGVSLESLMKRDASQAFKNLLQFEVARTRDFFIAGQSLPKRVRGRLRWELRMTWLGGVRVLDKIEAADYDVFAHRPTVTKGDWLRLLASAVFRAHGK